MTMCKVAGLLIFGALLIGTGALDLAQAEPSDHAGDAAMLHGPFYPNPPAARTANPMQEPVEPDLFAPRRTPIKRPLTSTLHSMP